MKHGLLLPLLLCCALNAKADAFGSAPSCSGCLGIDDHRRCHLVIFNSVTIQDFQFFIEHKGKVSPLEDSVLYHASRRHPVTIWGKNAVGDTTRHLRFTSGSNDQTLIFRRVVKGRNGGWFIDYEQTGAYHKDPRKYHRQADRSDLGWMPYAALSAFSLLLLLLRRRFRISR